MPPQTASPASKRSNHVAAVVRATTQLLTLTGALQSLSSEARQLGYLAGGAAPIADADMIGANAYLTGAQYQAAMQALAALSTDLTAAQTGGGTILATLLALKP
jgi:hypothetical protein